MCRRCSRSSCRKSSCALGLGGAAGALDRGVPARPRGATGARSCSLVALAAVAADRGHDRAAAGDVQRHPAFRVRAAAARGARRPRRRLADRGAARGSFALRRWSPSPSSSPASRLPVDRAWCGCIPTSTRTSTGSPAASQRAHDRYMLDYWGLAFKQASQALLAKLAERHETQARRPPLEDRGLRPASLAAGRARSRFRDHLGPAGRRLRDDARRVLLRQARRAGAGRDRARRRRLCARLRHPRKVVPEPARPSRACKPPANVRPCANSQ